MAINNKIAVIQTGGKQYIAQPGEILVVNKLNIKEKEKTEFNKILIYVDKQGEIKFGTPYLNKVKVLATVIKHDKGEKIRVARFKAKSRYRKVRGFRAYLTQIKIDKIEIK